MKVYQTLRLVLLIFFVTVSHASFAQFETPGAYMEHIGKANQAITEKYLWYLSGMSHGKSARKVEKRRQEVLQLISDTRYEIMGMPPFKGDRSLKDSSVAYLKILNSVFNEDYGKIVNMEEIAEQSYDLMEAYMLAQEKANEKLEEASQRQNEAQRQFAAKHNITLVDNQSATESKMKTASNVMKHYSDVYLVFFKVNKQEAYLMEALNQKNVNGIEQNINSLQTLATEGLEKLKGLKGYNNDPTLINACRDALNFYKYEAGQGAAMTDFFLKEENFMKMKKQFESKSASKRSKEEIDQFNAGVNEINATVKSYNSLHNELNKERNKQLNGWNNAVKKYLDEHVPTQRK